MSTIVLLGASLVLASCIVGGDDDATGDTTGATPTSAAATASTAATGSPAPTTATAGAATGGDLRLVSLSFNSGDSCPADSDHCQAPDRVQLLVDLVTTAKCPQVVALQDTAPWVRDLLSDQLPTWCNGQYKIVGDVDAVGRPMLITSLEVSDQEQVPLAGGQHTALWTRLGDEAGGQVDVLDARTGAGGDSLGVGATPCGTAPDTQCPEPCSPTGTMLDCQITQLGQIVQSKRDPNSSLVVVAADLGVTHEAKALDATFWNKGWRDAYLDAGNQECDPKFNAGCTSGRPSTGQEMYLALQNYNSVETARTDYVLVSPSLACSPRFDAATDADADGVGTGLFANRGPADRNVYHFMVWPSDHVGVSIDVSCI